MATAERFSPSRKSKCGQFMGERVEYYALAIPRGGKECDSFRFHHHISTSGKTKCLLTSLFLSPEGWMLGI